MVRKWQYMPKCRNSSIFTTEEIFRRGIGYPQCFGAALRLQRGTQERVRTREIEGTQDRVQATKELNLVSKQDDCIG